MAPWLTRLLSVPGNAIAVMGVVAVIAALVPEAPVWLRVILLVVAFGLMVLEIRALQGDRDIRDARHKELVALLKARDDARKQLESAPSGVLQKLRQLSYDILEFLTQRELDDFPYSDILAAAKEKAQEYLADTKMLFDEKYLPRARELRNDLQSRGINDPTLNGLIATTRDPIRMRLLAERLGCAAGVLANARAKAEAEGRPSNSPQPPA